MQFIRLRKLIDIEQREMPELVADWGETESVKSIDINVRQLRVMMLVSRVIVWSKS